MSYPWECLDCVYMNTNDIKNGKYYCEQYKWYVVAHSISCKKYFEKKEKQQGGCYITTIMCDILGYEDDCLIMNTLRHLRDNYMAKNDKYQYLLEEYDIVGPEIAKNIEKDENKKLIAKGILENYIAPAVIAIGSEENEQAIKIYKNLTYTLMDYYGIESIIDPNNPKHIKIRK